MRRDLRTAVSIAASRGQGLIDSFTRALNQLLDRTSGPFQLRFILQPIVAAVLAVRAGLKDARADRPAYLRTIIFQASERRRLIEEGCKDIGRVFILAFVVDAIYQLIVFRWFYPAQSLIVAFGLSIVPYAVIRGPVKRILSSRYCKALEIK